jgi:hypothetical protein
MTGEDRSRDRGIEETARRLFDESVRGLDGHTRSRLAQARAKAVEAAGKQRLGWWWRGPAQLVPLAGVAAAVLAVAVIWQNPGSSIGSAEPMVLGDLDILLESENFDLFEDLEFYAWLLEQPELLDADEAADGSG